MSNLAKVASPWSVRTRMRMLLWGLVWFTFCHWTPKPFNGWRLLWLKVFGCRIVGRPFVHQRARINLPWHVELQDRSCIGDRANLYALDHILVGEGAIVAQEAYLCTGDHDLTHLEKPLVTKPVHIGANAFVGARAFVLPGVHIRSGAVVGAAAVVTRDVEAGSRVAGNPARRIGDA